MLPRWFLLPRNNNIMKCFMSTSVIWSISSIGTVMLNIKIAYTSQPQNYLQSVKTDEKLCRRLDWLSCFCSRKLVIDSGSPLAVISDTCKTGFLFAWHFLMNGILSKRFVIIASGSSCLSWREEIELVLCSLFFQLYFHKPRIPCIIYLIHKLARQTKCEWTGDGGCSVK